MDKKSHFLYHFLSIPIAFFSISIPSPIPGIESGTELNSHSISELTPTLLVTGDTLNSITRQDKKNGYVHFLLLTNKLQHWMIILMYINI